MKRKLIRQMLNEWRSNIWLIIELTLVSVVVWYVATFFLQLAAIRLHDYGYDISTDIYVGTPNVLKEDNDSFEPYDSLHGYITDLADIRLRLAANPYVELIGIGRNAMSYSYNYHGGNLYFREGDSIYSFHGNIRGMSPEIPEIFRLHGIHGESPSKIADALRRGELLPGHCDFPNDNRLCDPSIVSGHEVWIYDTARVYRAGPAVHTILRSDYEAAWSGMIVQPLDGMNEWPDEIIIRVRPGQGVRFLESLTYEMLRNGNVYISDIKPVESLRQTAHYLTDSHIRVFSVGAVFMLIIVLLGFLGSFWFRTQERMPETAIRMTCGATPRDIFRRMMGEGMIMLLIATIIAVIIDWLCIHFDTIDCYYPGTEYCLWLAIPITAALLALIIVAGVWIPASKAIKINISQTLKEE